MYTSSSPPPDRLQTAPGLTAGATAAVGNGLYHVIVTIVVFLGMSYMGFEPSFSIKLIRAIMI